VRLNPRLGDKFATLANGDPRTYKIIGQGAEGEPTGGYTVIPDGNSLPDGIYLYIVKRFGAVTVFTRVDNALEVGSRHSIMPDFVQDEIVSAGELEKSVEEKISFNLKSYTFGDQLKTKYNDRESLERKTKHHFEHIFTGVRVVINDIDTTNVGGNGLIVESSDGPPRMLRGS